MSTDEHGHTPTECTDRECNGCMFCDGGLYGCNVCHGLEGAMPTNCPGESMSADRVDEVYAGKIDFRDGQWVEDCAPWSPARWARWRK